MKEPPGRTHIAAWMPLHLSNRNQKTLFCFPGAGCNVTCFLPLAECLEEEMNVYALQPRGLEGRWPPYPTVEAAVEDNIGALQAIQPTGPYQLLGHSFGGWHAFEMASRLVLAGGQVDPVFVLDSDPPQPRGLQVERRARLDILLELIQMLEDSADRSLGLDGLELEALSTDAQLLKLTEVMKAEKLLARTARPNVVADLVNVFEACANTTYTPANRLKANVLLIRAKSASAEDSTDAWREYASDVECMELPATHMSMLRKPLINVVAERIKNPSQCRWNRERKFNC